MHEPCLQWINVNGTIHHVSEYAELEPWQRPDANCPVCGRSVILKLGDIRTHHAAHYEGAICATTQPETVIHLNSKYHIQNILRSKNILWIAQKCVGPSSGAFHLRCQHERKKDFAIAQGWDQVEVEWTFGKYRLDVVLLKKGKVIGAVEILVTHPSEKGKIEFLNQSGISWIELQVTSDFYSVPAAWIGDTALEINACNELQVPSWCCEQCQKLTEEHEKAKERLRLQAEERKKRTEYASQFETRYLRFIDFYYPTGKKFRKLYVIQERYSQDNIIFVELKEFSQVWKQISIVRAPITKQSYEKLKDALEKELDRVRKPGWIIDRSRPWEYPIKNIPLKELRFSDDQLFCYEWINNRWQKVDRWNAKKESAPEKLDRPQKSDPLSQVSYSVSNSSHLDEVLELIFKEYTCSVCGKLTKDWVSGNGKDKTCLCRDCSNKQQRQ